MIADKDRNPIRKTLVSILCRETAEPLPSSEDTETWERLFNASRKEGLCGLVLAELRRRGGCVPATLLPRWSAQTEHIAASNRHLLDHVTRVATACRDGAVPILALKGIALLLLLYKDPALRPMCDVDLLIGPQDADRLDRILLEMGYIRGRNLLRGDFYPKYHYEREYVGPGPRPVRFDVHVRPWRPLRYGRIVPADALWDGPREVSSLTSFSETAPQVARNPWTATAGGFTSSLLPSVPSSLVLSDRLRPPAPLGMVFHTPNETNMVVHLACHAAFHGADRLLWLWDLHRFCNHFADTIDWSTLTARLSQWRLAYAARLAFARAEEAFGACLPPETRDALWRCSASWRDRLATWQAPRDHASGVRHAAVDLLCTSGWRHRLGYLAAVLLPDAGHFGQVVPRHDRGRLAWARATRLGRKILVPRCPP